MQALCTTNWAENLFESLENAHNFTLVFLVEALYGPLPEGDQYRMVVTDEPLYVGKMPAVKSPILVEHLVPSLKEHGQGFGDAQRRLTTQCECYQFRRSPIKKITWFIGLKSLPRCFNVLYGWCLNHSSLPAQGGLTFKLRGASRFAAKRPSGAQC
jgi:hypothetical protein